MRSIIFTAITIAAAACLAPTTEAAEIDFEYRVYVCEIPDYAIYVYKPGRLVFDSVQYTLEDAESRIDELEKEGNTAFLRGFHASQRWLNANSVYVRTFDELEDAQDYALFIEDSTGLYAWVKTVQLYPGGP